MKALAVAIALFAALPMSVQAQEDYIRNAKEYVDKADWKKAKVITLALTEHDYSPRDVVFKAGQPYKVELKNEGEKDHYFTAPDFFKSVAWRKVMVNKQAEIKAPYFTAIEVLKGGQVDLYFVAVKTGKYEVYCTIDDHREKGMETFLFVE